MRFAIAISIFLAVQAAAIADDRPLVDDGNLPSVGELRFNAIGDAPLKEGYVTLSWNAIASAAEYHVQGDAAPPIYRGPFPQAFVSGLADGHYEFHVHAFDAQGGLIASSQQPARVVVQHWSLTLAMSLFACGLIVFLAIVTVIAVGSWKSRLPTAGGDIL